jgi:hypothetical protein
MSTNTFLLHIRLVCIHSVFPLCAPLCHHLSHSEPITFVVLLFIINNNSYAIYRYWDTRQSNPVHVQQLPERCYALTVNYPLMIVGTADRNLIVFNLQNPQVIVVLNCLCIFWFLKFWVDI